MESAEQIGPPEPPTVDEIMAAHAGALPDRAPAEPKQGAPLLPPTYDEPGADAAPPAPPEAPPPETRQTDSGADTTNRLLALMEHERRVREAQEGVSKRELELRSQQEQLEARARELERYKQLEDVLLTRDAGAIADFLQVSPEELTESMRTGRGVDPSRQLQQQMMDRIQELEAKLSSRLDQREQWEQQQTAHEARREILTQLPQLSPALASLAEVHPGVVDDVIETMRSHYREHREVPSLEQVIPTLQSQATGQATKLMRALAPHLSDADKRELLTLLQAASSGDNGAGRVTTEAAVRPQKTLTNQATAPATRIDPNTNDLPWDREAALDALGRKYGF